MTNEEMLRQLFNESIKRTFLNFKKDVASAEELPMVKQPMEIVKKLALVVIIHMAKKLVPMEIIHMEKKLAPMEITLHMVRKLVMVIIHMVKKLAPTEEITRTEVRKLVIVIIHMAKNLAPTEEITRMEVRKLAMVEEIRMEITNMVRKPAPMVRIHMERKLVMVELRKVAMVEELLPIHLRLLIMKIHKIKIGQLTNCDLFLLCYLLS